jgi:predicted SnoaL-like aldol condensation-catalyzing enzyme
MKIWCALSAVSAVSLLVVGNAAAQQTPPAEKPANPTPGCVATSVQLEANKRVAMQFFTAPTADARVALADPSYKQHNPVFVKRAEADHVSDYEEFRRTFLSRGNSAQSLGPEPPGNIFEIVTAECDMVTIVHKRYVQDPTASAGTFYPAFSFDSFRVANGKLVEHWDGQQIPAPASQH